MITDVFGTSQRFNVPGAVSESNWSQRLALPISEWERDAGLRAAGDRINRLIRATRRTGTLAQVQPAPSVQTRP
jgi:4-alpha-glucanotransferase